MSSSPKQKKSVHYERGTKGSSHHHRSSRDSGVGTSSASDRASLGTPTESFNSSQIEAQRHSLRAVQEALDAANDRIGQLEASTAKLNVLLSDSNRENRLLKREKADLHNKIVELKEDLEHEKRKRRRASNRASPPRSSPSRREIEASAAAASAASSHRSERKSSTYQRPPPNSAPNPFLPSPRDPGLPVVTYAPAISVAYAPSAVSYSSAPVFAHAPLPSRGHYANASPLNDGKYHLTPL
ncbi:uncharacterized protein L3040_001468 [Drepanopeziza brunnea f. sp. 'multigermtubi']|uniref:Uncharacterized protein n=1 Tax=Marssonina brunnea f. sp. multigermtubi (strain MB_m1) TaxID=1072389 RepID=K1XVM0_MARBU|nr:uncharacterized protein MBM_05198 [Drepanopeziza brunnea f. sp. 'multigermtubi' MB_m1]EKD16729.1 hypothetical protein MBM_05198 [Drepanopeziza brunnea f. sp. 'multigermtubi' MB_m1]KAJ5051695.1 hypothetical protein L3040_001468 [Drepanopeziza brunnea f. sp. 'multigermtubi']